MLHRLAQRRTELGVCRLKAYRAHRCKPREVARIELFGHECEQLSWKR